LLCAARKKKTWIENNAKRFFFRKIDIFLFLL
jgi:hypothetical protein